MPRSLFTATHHRYVREGKYHPKFDVAALWDLDGVTPLFRIPACVIFVRPSASKRALDLKPGLVISGRLKTKEIPWSAAEPLLKLTDVEFELAFLGKRSAWRVAVAGGTGATVLETVAAARNHYLSEFRQGRGPYPQTLVIVETQSSVGRKGGGIRVETNQDAASTAKLPSCPPA